MKPPTLIVNSYGGSLMIAAQQEGHPIIGSYEDKDYGWRSQQLNYPNVDYRPYLADWPPDLDLRGAIVIAHPPCSGFSSNNRSKKVDGRGHTSAAFACTKRLLDYVLPRRPEAVVIESVIGALEGARHAHDFYGRVYGYNVYRIVQNAASFGVAQWRRRFWLVLTKTPGFEVRLKHNIVHVRDVLGSTATDPTVLSGHNIRWHRQMKMFKDIGLTDEQVQALLTGDEYGGLMGTFIRRYELPSRWWQQPEHVERMRRTVMGAHFTSGALYILNPDGFAPVLLALSWWWYGQRMVGLRDYKLLMGFPDDYRFHKERLTLELLSRGVCPPVARWILRQVRVNVFGEEQIKDYDAGADLLPGETANLLLDNELKRRQVSAAAEGAK